MPHSIGSPRRLWALFGLLFLLIGLQGSVAVFVLDDFRRSVAELQTIQAVGTHLDEFGFLLANLLKEMTVATQDGTSALRPPPTAALGESGEALRTENMHIGSDAVNGLLADVSDLRAAVALYDRHVERGAHDEGMLLYVRTIEPLADRLMAVDFPRSRQAIRTEVTRLREANRRSGLLARRVLLLTLTAALAVGLVLGRLIWAALHTATLQAVELDRRTSELAIAHGIQTSVLPRDLDLPGFDVGAEMLTATEVGGDFYEFRRTGDGGAWLAVGDVTGHGLRAGVIMLMVQSMFTALSADDESRPASPKSLLERLNRSVFLNLRDRLGEDRYVTMLIARLFADGRMIFAGAHTDILVYHRGEDRVARIQTDGPWLGIVEDVSHATTNRELILTPGDIALFHSDGVTEARNAAGVFFGLDRLADELRQRRGESAAALAAGLAARGRDWAHVVSDDMSVMVIKKS